MVGTTNLVLELVGELAKDLRKPRTINQLAHSSNKAYANVHTAISSLIKEKIIIKSTIGHCCFCRLNLANDKTLLYITLQEIAKRDKLLRENHDARLLLAKIDHTSAKLGTLFAWKNSHRLVIVTSSDVEAPQIFGMDTITVSLNDFLKNIPLRATISSDHTLLFGHALYSSIIRERPHDNRTVEVQR